jgi:methionyl-tRNA formyltransferase
MTGSDSIVVITSDGPEHKYVANLICANFSVSAIFVLRVARSRSAFLQRGPIVFLDKLLRHVYLMAVNDKALRLKALHSVLGEARCSEFETPDKLIRFDSRSARELAGAVQKFQPQIIAVYGTGKIPDKVLSTAKTIALNMHTGVSPFYRGTASTFWPIVENEAEKIGATVHECTSIIDGGTIFFSGRAPLHRRDNLHTIFARAVKIGAAGYVDVLRQFIARQVSGVPQDLTLGREYRGHMRGLRAEIRGRYNLARIRAALPIEESDA